MVIRLSLKVAALLGASACAGAIAMIAAPVASAACSNEEIRATQGSTYLPDCRSYELVSPQDQGEVDVNIPGAAYAFMPGFQASLGGERIAYQTDGALPGAASAGVEDENLAVRAATGWLTTPLAPPNILNPGVVKTVITGRVERYSPELSCGVEASVQPLAALPTGESAGTWNLYRRNSAGEYTLVTDSAPLNPEVSVVAPLMTVAVTANCERVLFESYYRYLPEAPEGVPSMYEWDAGALRLAGILPDGTIPAAGSRATVEGQLREEPAGNLLSSDGSRAFFTAVSDEGIDAGKQEVFMREDGGTSAATTVEVSGSATSTPDTAARYWAASATGSKVLFSANAGLTAKSSSTGTDLYEYDVETGRLTDLTVDTTDPLGAYVWGVLGASGNLSHVYFAAWGQLVAGKGQSETENYHQQEVNLYLYDEEAATPLTYVATVTLPNLLEGDVLGATATGQQARVSPSGGHLLFIASTKPTGYDNEDLQTGQPDAEAYLFSASSGKTVCVSCNPSGERPVGPTSVSSTVGGVRGAVYHLPRALTTGGRVFFESRDPLLRQASNGQLNVYEWEPTSVGTCTAEATNYVSASEGCLYLLDSGTSAFNTYFADASERGEDAFIVSLADLAPQASGHLRALYDVRVDGGFTAEPTGATCKGEECQGEPATAPAFTAPSSTSFSGGGNLAPKKSATTKSKHRRDNRAQRKRRRGLRKALRRCRHRYQHNRSRRRACERRVRRHYRTRGIASRHHQRHGGHRATRHHMHGTRRGQ